MSATHANEVRKRYGAQYYASDAVLSDAGLAAVDEYRKQFKGGRTIDHRPYFPRTEQRYALIGERFQNYFGEKVLDVGSRNDQLEKVLGRPCSLVDKNNPELPPFDWEKERLPFADASFDTVVCLDTLEHVDDMHTCFSDLVRVAKSTVIISLPNPWRRFVSEFVRGRDRFPQYGIPFEKPMDRHKWFFNTEEAEDFVFYHSAADRGNYIVREVVNHAPKTIARLKLQYPLLRTVLAEHHFKNLFVETNFFVIEKR